MIDPVKEPLEVNVDCKPETFLRVMMCLKLHLARAPA